MGFKNHFFGKIIKIRFLIYYTVENNLFPHEFLSTYIKNWDILRSYDQSFEVIISIILEKKFRPMSGLN